jgi:DNA-binding NtrC family response regulator
LCKILVVDDEAEVRQSIERRLQREGFSVDTGSGPQEAIEKIKGANPPFDIVLTDMVMGEESDAGVKVLEAAVTQDVFTEVIVLTAYGNVANAVECMKRGAFDYVQKNAPGVDVFEDIVQKINQAMDRRRVSVGTVRRMEWFARLVQD